MAGLAAFTPSCCKPFNPAERRAEQQRAPPTDRYRSGHPDHPDVRGAGHHRQMAGAQLAGAASRVVALFDARAVFGRGLCTQHGTDAGALASAPTAVVARHDAGHHDGTELLGLAIPATGRDRCHAVFRAHPDCRAVGVVVGRAPGRAALDSHRNRLHRRLDHHPSGQPSISPGHLAVGGQCHLVCPVQFTDTPLGQQRAPGHHAAGICRHRCDRAHTFCLVDLADPQYRLAVVDARTGRIQRRRRPLLCGAGAPVCLGRCAGALSLPTDPLHDPWRMAGLWSSA